LGLWELLITDQLVIRDLKKAAKALDGAGANISIGGGGGRFSAADREKNVNVVKGLLRPSSTKRKETDPTLSSWTTEFENLLMQSYTEQTMYDYKQGFMLLDGSRKLDEPLFDKVFKTLAAMANQGRGAVGYVIVGVADDAKTADRIKQIYGVTHIEYQRFLIVGIDHEAAKLPKKLDTYFLGITQRLANTQMSPWAKSQIARDIRLIKYFGRSLVVFKVEAGNEPCDFQGKYYERHGSNVVEVGQPQYAALFRRFLTA
jgi:hypothetical protein